MALVYIATSPSGKKYVGKTVWPFLKRKNCHLWHADNGSNFPIHRAIRKFGNNIKWEIYKSGISEEEANKLEIKLIKNLNTLGPNGYNCTVGGDGSSGFKHSFKTRSIMSLHRKGKKFSVVHKKRISKALTGKHRPLEVREKISKKLTGSAVRHDGKNHGLYKTNKTGYSGVSFHKCTGKFIAQINTGGIKKYLGIFKTPESAAIKYNEAAIFYFGDMATVNKIINIKGIE